MYLFKVLTVCLHELILLLISQTISHIFPEIEPRHQLSRQVPRKTATFSSKLPSGRREGMLSQCK
jgi:hypothetical protein